MDQCKFRCVDRQWRRCGCVGIVVGCAARRMRAERRRVLKAVQTHRPKPLCVRHLNHCWQPRAAIGAGGSVPNTALQMTPNSTPCFVNISRASTWRWGNPRHRIWPSPSSGKRNARCRSHRPDFSRRRSMAAILLTSNGSARDCILQNAAAAPCTAAFSIYANCAMALRKMSFAFVWIPFRYSARDGRPGISITIGGAEELSVVVRLERGRLVEFAVEQGRVCLLNPKSVADAAFDRVLEICVQRSALNLKGQKTLRLGVALWHAGLPVDVLPAEGALEVALGDELSSWPIES